MDDYKATKGGWISTVYGNVQLCDLHLSGYPMRAHSDNIVRDRMVVCEVCHPETAIERPKMFGEQPRFIGGNWKIQ